MKKLILFMVGFTVLWFGAGYALMMYQDSQMTDEQRFFNEH